MADVDEFFPIVEEFVRPHGRQSCVCGVGPWLQPDALLPWQAVRSVRVLLCSHRPWQTTGGISAEFRKEPIMVVSDTRPNPPHSFSDAVLYYWSYGMDSADIAEILECTEALVYNVLGQKRMADGGLSQ